MSLSTQRDNNINQSDSQADADDVRGNRDEGDRGSRGDAGSGSSTGRGRVSNLIFTKHFWTHRHGNYGSQVFTYPALGHCREATHNYRMGSSLSN